MAKLVVCLLVYPTCSLVSGKLPVYQPVLYGRCCEAMLGAPLRATACSSNHTTVSSLVVQFSGEYCSFI